MPTPSLRTPLGAQPALDASGEAGLFDKGRAKAAPAGGGGGAACDVAETRAAQPLAQAAAAAAEAAEVEEAEVHAAELRGLGLFDKPHERGGPDTGRESRASGSGSTGSTSTSGALSGSDADGIFCDEAAGWGGGFAGGELCGPPLSPERRLGAASRSGSPARCERREDEEQGDASDGHELRRSSSEGLPLLRVGSRAATIGEVQSEMVRAAEYQPTPPLDAECPSEGEHHSPGDLSPRRRSSNPRSQGGRPPLRRPPQWRRVRKGMLMLPPAH